MATAGWFHDHDVAAVAIDTLVLEVYPCESEDLFLPVHLLHLVEMGMTQGQNWFLDDLADACAADGRYSFLLDATPLPFTGGARAHRSTRSPCAEPGARVRSGAVVRPRGGCASAVRADAAPPPTTGPVRGPGSPTRAPGPPRGRAGR